MQLSSPTHQQPGVSAKFAHPVQLWETQHPQMSSCYLLDLPEDNLDAIYDRYRDVARLSKHAGRIGLSYSRFRVVGFIRGTNDLSNGIVPWLASPDSRSLWVNQGGRRKGAAGVNTGVVACRHRRVP